MARCPPSSGSRGSRLNAPTKMFSEATISITTATLAGRAAAAVLGEQVRDRLGQADHHPGRPGQDLAELAARVGDGAYRPGPLEHDDGRDAQVRPLAAVDDGQVRG